jgi:hypothetical protein
VLVSAAHHAAKIAGRAQKNRLDQAHNHEPVLDNMRLFTAAVCAIEHIVAIAL